MIHAYIMVGYSPRHLPLLARRNVPIGAGPPTIFLAYLRGTPSLTSHGGSTVLPSAMIMYLIIDLRVRECDLPTHP
jgi:hypothetical protein